MRGKSSVEKAAERPAALIIGGILMDIVKIYFMNLINDIDNILILSTVIRKYGYQVKSLFGYIVLSLTVTRTMYVMVIQTLAQLPGLRIFTGIILLFIAFRLAWSMEQKDVRPIPSISFFKMMLIILATDFSVCLDSVMITAEISSNPLFIFIGIFLSVATIFIVFISFSKILGNTSWIQVIASGLIAHIAILGIARDSLSEHPLKFFEKFLEIHINNWINVFALDIAIFIIIFGVIRRLQNRTLF
ncbi:tellurium resistance protein TerC [Bacillus salipaludis]|uniref:TerC family protein n=1 Tax=Bacillus salipaludis TaxID=2547811 RepID=UPI003D1DF0F6